MPKYRGVLPAQSARRRIPSHEKRKNMLGAPEGLREGCSLTVLPSQRPETKNTGETTIMAQGSHNRPTPRTTKRALNAGKHPEKANLEGKLGSLGPQIPVQTNADIYFMCVLYYKTSPRTCLVIEPRLPQSPRKLWRSRFTQRAYCLTVSAVYSSSLQPEG